MYKKLTALCENISPITIPLIKFIKIPLEFFKINENKINIKDKKILSVQKEECH